MNFPRPVDTFSLYLHVPFCSRKCRYCDFYSHPPAPGAVDRWIDAVCREWDLLREEVSPGRCVSIFVGGGTPSLLTGGQWEKLAGHLFSRLERAPGIEWTAEANPESLTAEKLALWRETGVTRLSVGVQTLNDRLLRFLGRSHRVRDIRRVLDLAGIRRDLSWSFDYILGLPGQTVEGVYEEIGEILSRSGADHLSAYHLTLHDTTPLGRHHTLFPLPDEAAEVAMTESVTDGAEQHGLFRYEVSSFARPGRECIHNVGYWERRPCVGLGPGAHSFIPEVRWANVTDTGRYNSLLEERQQPLAFREELTPREILQEIIFLGLRTTAGIDAGRFFAETGEPLHHGERKDILDRLVAQKMVVFDGRRYYCTSAGLNCADGIARMLLPE